MNSLDRKKIETFVTQGKVDELVGFVESLLTDEYEAGVTDGYDDGYDAGYDEGSMNRSEATD